MITVTTVTVDIKKTLTFTLCYSLTVKQCVVIVCTAVRRQAPALLAALPLLTQQDTSPTLHSFSSDHPFNWLWRPSGLGNSSFDLSRLFGSILYGCGPSYILVVIATSSSSQSIAIVLVLDWGYSPPRLPNVTSPPNCANMLMLTKKTYKTGLKHHFETPFWDFLNHIHILSALCTHSSTVVVNLLYGL